MLINFSEKHANELYAPILAEDEISYPIYCMYRGTGFFDSNSMDGGYITCTNKGRIITAKDTFGKWSFVVGDIRTVKDIKIKKTFFKQYIIEMALPTEKKDYKIKFQVAPKVYGCDLPNQGRNMEKMLEILQNGRVE